VDQDEMVALETVDQLGLDAGTVDGEALFDGDVDDLHGVIGVGHGEGLPLVAIAGHLRGVEEKP
jgi:hypothetical protein